jgi:hypothetical protein
MPTTTSADTAIANCDAHLTTTNSFNTEIESYLVKYLLVLICSEYEEMVRGAVGHRAAGIADPDIAAFITSATAQLFRSLRISELGGLLARFAPGVKDGFVGNVNNTPAHTAFDTILNNRMQAAHSTGVVNLTFVELRLRYEESKEVVRHFAAALGVAAPC